MDNNSKDTNSFRNLNIATSASVLITHHKEVQLYHQVRNQSIITAMSYVQGEQFSTLQLQRLKRKNKAPIVFNYIKPSYRTVLGTVISNKYDIEFNPREPTDESVSQVLKNWYTYTAYQDDFQKSDIELLMNAWTGGTAYSEIYLKSNPGRVPEICCQTLNPLCIYPDPNSRDLGSRQDATFIDRVLWMSKEDLELTFPRKDFSALSQKIDGTYLKTNPSKDNDHEIMDQKNGTYKVIERLYKVYTPTYYSFDDNYNKITHTPDEFKMMTPDDKEYVNVEPLQTLHTAIVCPAWSNSEFIFNGKYHVECRDFRTMEVMFPIQELVAEGLNGKADGFVTHMISPQNLINSSVTQIYHQMKMGTGAQYAIDKTKFESDDEAKNFAQNHTDADQVFSLKEDVTISEAIQIIPRNDSVNSNNANVFNYGLDALREISSTPPAAQGLSEASGTSGVLNQQRIDQAFIQLQGLTFNFKNFQKRRAKLMLAYLYEKKELFADQVIRIIEPDKSSANSKYITLMETSEIDPETGAVQRLNDPTTYDFDIDISDSYYSPDQRTKNIKSLTDVLTSGMLNADPAMASYLVIEILNLMDISQKTKDAIIGHASVAQQQQQVTNNLDNQSKLMSNAAQADQLMMPPPEQQSPGQGAAPGSNPFPV